MSAFVHKIIIIKCVWFNIENGFIQFMWFVSCSVYWINDKTCLYWVGWGGCVHWNGNITIFHVYASGAVLFWHWWNNDASNYFLLSLYVEILQVFRQKAAAKKNNKKLLRTQITRIVYSNFYRTAETIITKLQNCCNWIATEKKRRSRKSAHIYTSTQ